MSAGSEMLQLAWEVVERSSREREAPSNYSMVKVGTWSCSLPANEQISQRL